MNVVGHGCHSGDLPFRLRASARSIAYEYARVSWIALDPGHRNFSSNTLSDLHPLAVC